MTANQLIFQITHDIGGSGNAHLAMTIEEVRKDLPREISLLAQFCLTSYLQAVFRDILCPLLFFSDDLTIC